MAKSSTRRVTIYINGKEVEASVKQIRSEMNKLVNEQNRMAIGSDEYIAHAKKIKELREYLKEHARNIGSAASAWSEMYNKVLQFGTGIGGLTQILSSLDNVTSTLKQVATDLAAMDDVYSDVIKTTGLTSEEVDELNESFKNLDTQTSREQLNNLAYIAGKLDISTKEMVQQFVEAADSIIVTMTYHSDSADKNLTGMVRTMEARDWQDSVLRKKECEVDYATGRIVNLRLYNDHDTAETDLQYDGFGNLLQATGPANGDGQRVMHRYTYDGTLHTYPVAVRNVPFGYVSTATYDFRIGKPTSTTDINGNTINYEYDWSGRLVSLTAPGEQHWTIAHEYWINYDYLNETEYVTKDSFPWARTRHYDIQHENNTLNTTIIVDGLGRAVQTKKDAEIQGQEQSLVSGKVNYDAFGRPAVQHHPFADSSLDTLFKTDPQPTVASRTSYDILDRPVRVTLPYGTETSNEYGFGIYDGRHCFKTETTDPLGNVVTALTDARGLSLEHTVNDTVTTAFVYDALGQLLRSTDPDGLITDYQYDKFGQLVERFHPDAGTDTYEYDAAGNVVSHTNGNNQTMHYRYDYNRLTDVEYPDNPINNVHYIYGDSTAGHNGKGRIVMQEDGSGFQTFKYGKLGELTENIRTFALPFENQTYTFKMNFEYDPFNRIQSILYPDSERVEYRYNLGGMLKKVTGSVTRKITDLVVVAPMQNTSLLQGGNEIQGGDIAPGIIPDPGPIEIQTVTLRYPYLDSIVYNKFELKDSVTYGNGTRVRYVYDSLQRLTALRSYTADDELMQDIAYHYDSVGNILDIENSASTLGNGLGGAYRQEYTYDNLYRLTRATGWWECHPDHLTLYDTVDMRYSKNGRIISKRMSAETLKNMQLNLVRYDRQYQYPSVYSNKVNSVTDALSGTSHQFEWESGGNLMRHANPDQHYDRRLWWTEDNRLQFVKDNGSTGAYYQYDAGGDRTYKLLYHKTTGSLNGVQTDYYTLDDATLYVSPYLVVTPQGYTKHYYAESKRITTQLGKYRFAVVDSCVAGDSLAFVKLQNAAQSFPTDSFPTPAPMLGYLHSLVSKPKAVSTLYFYHPDHLGSASWITNIYGRTIQHLYYLPWGEDFVNQRTGSFSSMYTFSAKEKDTETGYSYFGARYYSSDLSVWQSVDPQAAKYPSLSPYVYCADNPIKLVDPNGEEVDDNFDKWKYNKTTGQLDWISNEGGRSHQIVVETQDTPLGEKVYRTVEFDGTISRLFDFSLVSKTVDGIIGGTLDMYGGATTVMAGLIIATGGSVISGGAALPVGSVIFSAGAYQTTTGLMQITNAIAGRGVDMYKQQELVRDICKSSGNSLIGVLSEVKPKPFAETIKNTVKTAGKSIASFSISAAWSAALRYRTKHPKYKGLPTDAKVY